MAGQYDIWGVQMGTRITAMNSMDDVRRDYARGLLEVAQALEVREISVSDKVRWKYPVPALVMGELYIPPANDAGTVRLICFPSLHHFFHDHLQRQQWSSWNAPRPDVVYPGLVQEKDWQEMWGKLRR